MSAEFLLTNDCAFFVWWSSATLGEGIKIIGLNYKDERSDAIQWLDKYGNPYEISVHDLKGSLALDLGVTGAPETFLVSNGKVVAHYQGEVNDVIWSNVFLPIIKEKGMF